MKKTKKPKKTTKKSKMLIQSLGSKKKSLEDKLHEYAYEIKTLTDLLERLKNEERPMATKFSIDTTYSRYEYNKKTKKEEYRGERFWYREAKIHKNFIIPAIECQIDAYKAQIKKMLE